MTSPPSQQIVCSACGTSGVGRFCAQCGATLSATACSACQAPLSPGARFCHRCGKPAGAAPSPATQATPAQGQKPTSSLPWVVAAVALVALLVISAGKFLTGSSGSSPDAAQTPLSQAPLGDQSGGRAPDISRMSPEEQAERLFTRVMRLASEGKTDSVLFFAPMALDAYQLLSPQTVGHRYEVGRIAEVAGALPLARAQADTILRENPNHLLGLVLGARIASASGDAAARRQYETRLLSAGKTEKGRKLPEYERHQDDITAALANARRSVGNRG